MLANDNDSRICHGEVRTIAFHLERTQYMYNQILRLRFRMTKVKVIIFW